MKLNTTTIAALFGLLMMAMPSIASAEIVRWYPRPVRPVVVEPAFQPILTPAPFTTAAYYRPWACANPYFRHHHRWECR
jgi:hypothetical protein